ncbi:hypothetical protein TorRG33x02_262760 [Trema orientale]|uniref:Uncharacterized protein n=1 Tax=Trema orientale TaxID=63057 RepID=A0A2P5D4E0_TREOI|nr:hypothetical protein TorRG33x02_262760 [Trema orientale]
MSEIIQSARRSPTWPLIISELVDVATCLSFIECREDWGPRDTCLVETHIRIFTTANSGDVKVPFEPNANFRFSAEIVPQTIIFEIVWSPKF